MTDNGDVLQYYEVLEIPVGSSLRDVEKAYSRLRELYSTESMVTLPMLDDYPEERMGEILEQVEHAYQMMTAHFEKLKADNVNTATSLGANKDMIDQVERGEVTGELLKQARERLGIQLHEVELSTRIRALHIDSIERERFDKLPDAVFVKGYLRTYARLLSFEPDKIIDPYMQRLNAAKAV